MATYPRVTPATLTNYQAVINDPTSAEDANKAADIYLQTRQFVFDFLDAKFDKSASDVLKPAALVSTSLAAKVNGHTSNSGTQREIVAGTVSTPDMRDDAITAAKLATDAVTTVKIAALNVTTAKVNDAAITTPKIADVNVTTAKLANDAVDADKLKDDATGAAGAVTTDHIRHLAVTTAKLAANCVDGNKLMLSGSASPRILVGNASQIFTSVAMSGAATIDATGVVTLATQGRAVVREKAANTVAAGASIAGGAAYTNLNTRGVSFDMTILYDTLTMVTTPSGTNGKVALTAGTYVFEFSAPAYSVGLHVCRLGRYNSSNVFQEGVFGSAENAPVGQQTVSRGYARFVIASGDYVLLQHWTELVKATNGLGLPCSAGADEVYAQLHIQRLS